MGNCYSENISTSQYNFDKAGIALIGSVPQTPESEKASTPSKTYYGQLEKHYKSMRIEDSAYRIDSKSV